MEGMGMDLFATKGIEYLLVIAYLSLLVICWRFVTPSRSRATAGAGRAPGGHLGGARFELPTSLLYHQGHAWALPEANGVVRVGLDDFAQKLLGPVMGLTLPEIGTSVEEGEPAWQILVDGRPISVLSPVTGEVLARNEEAARSPGLVNSEPYDRGWLLEVRLLHPLAARRNLLSGRVAEAWLDEVSSRVRDTSVEGGEAAEEGGPTPAGLAHAQSPDAWEELATELLLSEPEAESGDLPDWERATDEEHRLQPA